MDCRTKTDPRGSFHKRCNLRSASSWWQCRAYCSSDRMGRWFKKSENSEKPGSSVAKGLEILTWVFGNPLRQLVICQINDSQSNRGIGRPGAGINLTIRGTWPSPAAALSQNVINYRIKSRQRENRMSFDKDLHRCGPAYFICILWNLNL